MDSTRVRSDGRRLVWLLAAAAIVLCLAGGWLAASARADGDPASDVLATQRLFLPQDAGVPNVQAGQLAGLLREAARDGYPIRVALISSPTDLGSVTELWRQPVDYAKFLGQELSLTYRGRVLVIMPDGFGLSEQGHALPERDLAGISIAASGTGLASTAEQAVQRLATADGHTLPLPRTQSPGATGSSDAVVWAVFGLGLVLTGMAWAASFRARPPGFRRHDAPAG